MGSVVNSLFGGDSPQGGINTGDVAYSTQENLNSGTADVGRSSDQYAWAKELGQNNVDFANLGAADVMNVGNDAWSKYQSLYSPAEAKSVSDAMNYDSPDQMERVRQEAAGNANQSFDTSLASRNLGLEHMGVNPNSGRFVDPSALSGARAAAVAGAMNEATTSRQNTAIGLRQQTVASGRQLPGLSMEAPVMASGMRINAANAGLSDAGLPTQWSGLSTPALTSGAATQLGLEQAQTGAYNAETQRFATTNKAVEDWFGGSMMGAM